MQAEFSPDIQCTVYLYLCLCACILYLCVRVHEFYVTLSHIIADNLLKLQHTPGNYPGTGCVLVPNPRKLCYHLPLPFSLSRFLHIPSTTHPNHPLSVASNFQFAGREYEKFALANLLYGILIVFAQLKLGTGNSLG